MELEENKGRVKLRPETIFLEGKFTPVRSSIWKILVPLGLVADDSAWLGKPGCPDTLTLYFPLITQPVPYFRLITQISTSWGRVHEVLHTQKPIGNWYLPSEVKFSPSSRIFSFYKDLQCLSQKVSISCDEVVTGEVNPDGWVDLSNVSYVTISNVWRISRTTGWLLWPVRW